MENVVLKHNDVAEFYYQFLGDKWEEPRDNVLVTLHLPPHGAQIDEILAWGGHGPREGSVSIVSPSEIVWESVPSPPARLWKGESLFPPGWYPLAKRTTNKAAFETIVAEEEGRVLRRERREKLKKVDPYTALFAVAIFYLLNVYIWHNYAKPPPGLRRKVLQRITRQLRTGGIGRAFGRFVDGKPSLPLS